MNSDKNKIVSLIFQLDVDDGWPPVAEESLPFVLGPSGYTVAAAPLFIKDLSVDDLIDVTFDEHNRVGSWRHLVRSGRTTIWLLRLRRPNQIAQALADLRSLGCNTAESNACGCYSVDVPESVSMHSVDTILETLDSDAIAVAFPSMRHSDGDAPVRRHSSNRHEVVNSTRAAVKVGYIITSNQVAKERKPVGYLFREEPDNENDSGWRVFSGSETQDYADDAANFAMYNASTILEIDPTIATVLDSPWPVAFERGTSGTFERLPADVPDA